MDHALTCNALSCRKELTDRALVTSCSHIFCVECAHKVNRILQDNQNRCVCPACGSHLATADDAIVTNLNPSEDYKTSVLSGLSPNIIMECAGRALSFWAYQATQDICYQQYLYKTLTEKYSTLNMRLDKTVNEANSEIDRLHHNISRMTSEQEALRRKNEELAQAYKDKSRKLLQTQELYDKAKRKAEMGFIQRAALDAVDSTLSNHCPSQAGDESTAPYGGLQSGTHLPTLTPRFDNASMNTGVQRTGNHQTQGGGTWGRSSLHSRASAVPQNSSNQQFGNSTVLGQGLQALGRGTPGPQHDQANSGASLGSQAFGGSRPGFGGVGLTSGLKVSQAPSLASLNASMAGR